jgi:hypothetical protein
MPSRPPCSGRLWAPPPCGISAGASSFGTLLIPVALRPAPLAIAPVFVAQFMSGGRSIATINHISLRQAIGPTRLFSCPIICRSR